MIHAQTVLHYSREPLYCVGTSTGKDSVATMLWAIHKSGLPRERLRFTFNDTGNEDPLTYAHLLWLEANLVEPAGIIGGIETLLPERNFFDLCLRKGRFPSRKAQFCTIELKIEPIRAWIRRQWAKGEDVVLINGKRLGESNERKLSMADDPERAFSDYWGCEEWSPLRHWTLKDVLAIHKEFGVPLNPLYAMGAKRVGCWPCINCGKDEIRLVAKHRPEKIVKIKGEEQRHLDVNGRVSTFFHSKTTTKNWHDRTYTDSDGKKWSTAGIENVVEWAKTKRGGKERMSDAELDAAPACHVGYLACE